VAPSVGEQVTGGASWSDVSTSASSETNFMVCFLLEYIFIVYLQSLYSTTYFENKTYE